MIISQVSDQCRMASTVVTLLLLLANDVEQNPGPNSPIDKRQERVERFVNELQRDVKTLRKVVEQLTAQMDSQAVRERPKMASLMEEVNVVKETMNIQVGQSKRLKSDIATLEYDLAALKKVGAQQRNDLKQIGNLIMSELKSLREKSLEHEESLNRECKISQKFTTDLPVMVTSIRVVGNGLGDLKKEVTGLQQTSAAQLEAMEAAVTNLHQNTYDMSTQLSNLEAEHSNLRASMLEQMTSINEAVEAQTGLIKMHDQFINELQSVAKTSAETNQRSFQQMDDQVTSIQADLADKSETWRGQFENMSEMVNGHDVTVGQICCKLDKLNMEFRGVLQTVDDQVNANQMRLEAMVAMASDKASQMRKEVETRSMEDRRLFNLELRNQSEKVVNALQKLSFRLDEMDGMYDDMQERLYEVDKTRKNNLVFYGVPQQMPQEDPDETERLIKNVITVKLQVRREITFTKVNRLWNGPSFRNLKPILVTFHLFKDKEDILRKSALLRGTNIYITEDYSRKVRRHREELLKFARLIKSRQNGVRCLLQYDRLYVGNDVFLYNEIEQRVQKVLMKIPEAAAEATRMSSSAPTSSKRDLGLPAEAFEDPPSCCSHCCSAVVAESHHGPHPKTPTRPSTVPAYQGHHQQRQQQHQRQIEDDLCLEETIIEPLQNQSTNTLISRGHRMSALEVVQEEERSAGTTPSPNYLPDIHHNQKVL